MKFFYFTGILFCFIFTSFQIPQIESSQFYSDPLSIVEIEGHSNSVQKYNYQLGWIVDTRAIQNIIFAKNSPINSSQIITIEHLLYKSSARAPPILA